MISIKDFGGWARLGNQMFQYAFLKAISLENNLSIQLPTGKTPFGHKEPQIYSAFYLNIEELKQGTVFDVVHAEKSINFDKNLMLNMYSHDKNILFTGYFQSHKYFSKHSDIIKSDFTFKEHLRVKGDIFIKNMRKLNKPLIAMHVRRTDIVNGGSTIVVSDSYREISLKYINEKICKDYHILIFSDDIKWCKNNLKYPNQTFVEGFSDLEDLYTMSLCDHFIISASTFSWWAAWLSCNENKIVIVPDKWFKHLPSEQECDLFPESWVRICN